MKNAVDKTTVATHEDRDSSRAAQRTSTQPAWHSMLQLQRMAGNQAVGELLRRNGIQAKLAVSQPNDPAEHEADQIADRIMRAREGAPISSQCSCANGEEMCEGCGQK